ncbi:helix-turn-helix domain-containing protein [Pedobacter nutrimenti]|uniref:Helix-turn-helix protein n=1 Tax=Pedobacter nutrimenti TaxID=1241337 RepID=A0A318UJ26_9SPHI|nr:helix-turn-helix transcriptional regulator [Pedobacter nutrimenti]PYF76133.1 helix-turn-helix protein [Pedobacter nutrimenti]
MRIGDNIQAIREKETELKREDVANVLGITTKAYSNIENNVADVTISRLFELAEIFKCSPDYIINYQEKATYTNHFNNYEGNNGINIMYQGCTPDQVKNLETELHESQDKLKHLRGTIKSRDN